MAAVKGLSRSKTSAVVKAAKKSKQRGSRITDRKYLSPAMLDALIQHSPLHPAAETGSDKPPFESQDD